MSENNSSTTTTDKFRLIQSTQIQFKLKNLLKKKKRLLEIYTKDLILDENFKENCSKLLSNILKNYTIKEINKAFNSLRIDPRSSEPLEILLDEISYNFGFKNMKEAINDIINEERNYTEEEKKSYISSEMLLE